MRWGPILSKPEAETPAGAGNAADVADEQLIVRLGGFDGPLDLLLELARGQKFDMANLPIVALVDQYLAVVEGTRRVKLELAADWLVMAAWLTWLKSKLLLPKEEPAAEEAQVAADVLAQRLRELGVMRAAAAWLAARPALGQEVFARGAAENLIATDRSKIAADLPMLLRAYIDGLRRGTVKPRYAPRQLSLWTVQDAIRRLSSSLPGTSGWSELETFLPANLDGQEKRAAVASTLLASLELARGGGIRLHQEAPFAPILVGAGEVALLPSDEDDAGPDAGLDAPGGADGDEDGAGTMAAPQNDRGEHG